MTLPRSLTVATLTMAALFAFEAGAATIRITCEVRPDRSKISVDGKQLPRGTYTTEAVSGGNVANSPPRRARRGQVETDYDSNTGELATPIPFDFIVDGTVSGKVIDAAGNTVASDTVACEVRLP
jgi:hypothetical protein